MALGHTLFSFRWMAKSNKLKVAAQVSGYNFLMKKGDFLTHLKLLGESSSIL